MNIYGGRGRKIQNGHDTWDRFTREQELLLRFLFLPRLQRLRRRRLFAECGCVHLVQFCAGMRNDRPICAETLEILRRSVCLIDRQLVNVVQKLGLCVWEFTSIM